MKKALNILWILAVLAIAFGYIEGAAVHYLRIIYYPHGFTNTLQNIDLHTLLIESGREFATLIVLIAVAMIASGPYIIKLVNFVFIFAIWDIVYYIALFLFEGWPGSLLSWDVLFLIPVPWFSPVIAPIAISVIGIGGALLIYYIHNKNGTLSIGWPVVFLLTAALLFWLASFLLHSPFGQPVYQFPEHYNWVLFISGIILAFVGFLIIFKINTYGKKIAK